MLLSIAMIVKNEEKNIERCLKALKQLDNRISYEIVIVDTGSSDKTIDIAKKYTDRVYEHKWNNDFADMRNKSIRYCRGKWILVLDADEVLENPEEIIRFFSQGECNKYNCAVIQFKNVLSDNEDNILLGSLIRLFKNKQEFCYSGRVHEQPKLIAPIGYSNITLRHYGYSRESYELMEYKYQRNLKLLLKDLEEGKDLVYTYFQLAQTYAMANRNNEALDSIKNAYRIAKTKDMHSYLYILHFYARDMLGRGDYEKVIELCKEALKYTDEHLDFYYLALRSYKAINKYEKEEEYINKYFALYNKIKEGYIVKDISVNCFSFSNYNDVVLYDVINAYNRKDYEKIVSLFSLVKKDNDKEKLVEIYSYALLKLKRYDDVKEYFKSKKELKDKDITNILNVLNRICMESVDIKSSEIVEKFKGIDKKIDQYIENRYKDKKISSSDCVEFDGYTEWKGEIASNIYCENEGFIDKLKYVSNSDIKTYISRMVQNYKCLENLCKYSEKNFMSTNINELNLVIGVEEVLLTNKSIEKDEYQRLAMRAVINKISYFNMLYNMSLINEDNAKCIFSKHDFVMYEVYSAMKIYDDDKLKYIRKLKSALENSPEYSNMIGFLLKKVDKVEISDDMKREKQSLLNIAEQSIGGNNLNQAQEIINELMKIFEFDHQILSFDGVLKYISAEYDKSLINLGLADMLCNDNFDTVYNIACVMEASGRKEDASNYYKKAYSLCLDENMKKEIMDVINALREA